MHFCALVRHIRVGRDVQKHSKCSDENMRAVKDASLSGWRMLYANVGGADETFGETD